MVLIEGLIPMRSLRIAAAMWLAACVLSRAQATVENPPEKPGEALYLRLGQVGLDPERVYQVRSASLDRSAVHISLEDGTIGFTQDVMGRITGACFEGYGEVLLTPPNQVERRSMSLFTGMAILEEHFSTAYFRFNDDAASEMRPDLRATDNQQEFVKRWGETGGQESGKRRCHEAADVVQPDASGERPANYFRTRGPVAAGRSVPARSVPGNHLRGFRRVLRFRCARNRLRRGKRKRPRMANFTTTCGPRFPPAMRRLPKRAAEGRLKMRKGVRAGSRSAATRSPRRCSLRNGFMPEPACSMT